MAASNKLRRVRLRLNLKTSRINILVVSLCSKRLMQTPGSECTGIHWHSFSVIQGLWTPASGHPVEESPGPDAMRCRMRKVLYGMSALCKHGGKQPEFGQQSMYKGQLFEGVLYNTWNSSYQHLVTLWENVICIIPPRGLCGAIISLS